MTWSGAVQCPDCGLPIDTDTSVCPYCYSSSPHSAPWQAFGIGDWWWVYLPAFAGLAVFAVALASDAWFDTQWLPRLLKVIADFGK